MNEWRNEPRHVTAPDRLKFRLKRRLDRRGDGDGHARERRSVVPRERRELARLAAEHQRAAQFHRMKPARLPQGPRARVRARTRRGRLRFHRCAAFVKLLDRAPRKAFEPFLNGNFHGEFP